jgi:thiamine transporter ThiT
MISKILTFLLQALIVVVIFGGLSMLISFLNLWSVNTIFGRVVVPIGWATVFAGAWLALILGWLTGASKTVTDRIG